jgi:Cu(I)/Ag(I) efflux system membrane protein CusA/SilA
MIGGERVTTTVEGRERFPVRIRYHRELRDSIETIGKVLVPAFGGPTGKTSEAGDSGNAGIDRPAGEASATSGDERTAQVPLEQLAAIRYVRGPQMIKSEDTFLTSYVLFDKKAGAAEVDVVEQAQRYRHSIFQFLWMQDKLSCPVQQGQYH